MLYCSIFTQCLQTCYTQSQTLYGQVGQCQWHRHLLSRYCMGICSTYHTVLKASPGAAIFGRDMLFDILFIADWKIIGEHRQRLTDLNTARENEGRIDYDYKVGQKILVPNKGILRKAQSIWQKDPWTITTVHTNGTITIQRRDKLDWILGE